MGEVWEVPPYSSKTGLGRIWKRLTKTLLFASMTAILSWLPLLIGNYLVADHEVYIPPHSYWLYVILMNYTNSIVNPVLYALRISEFRSSLLLLCLRRPVVVRARKEGNKEMTEVTFQRMHCSLKHLKKKLWILNFEMEEWLQVRVRYLIGPEAWLDLNYFCLVIDLGTSGKS